MKTERDIRAMNVHEAEQHFKENPTSYRAAQDYLNAYQALLEVTPTSTYYDPEQDT